MAALRSPVHCSRAMRTSIAAVSLRTSSLLEFGGRLSITAGACHKPGVV
ncbi:hypothetical protein [Lysobacter gummosus]